MKSDQRAHKKSEDESLKLGIGSPRVEYEAGSEGKGRMYERGRARPDVLLSKIMKASSVPITENKNKNKNKRRPVQQYSRQNEYIAFDTIRRSIKSLRRRSIRSHLRESAFNG